MATETLIDLEEDILKALRSMRLTPFQINYFLSFVARVEQKAREDEREPLELEKVEIALRRLINFGVNDEEEHSWLTDFLNRCQELRTREME